MRGVLAETVAQLVRALDQLERAQARAGDRRRHRVGEEIRTGALAEQLDDLAAAGDVAAARTADRLAERAGEDVDPFHDAVMLVRAAAAGSDDADSVRVVD